MTTCAGYPFPYEFADHPTTSPGLRLFIDTFAPNVHLELCFCYYPNTYATNPVHPSGYTFPIFERATPTLALDILKLIIISIQFIIV